MAVNLTPLHDRVIVKRIEEKETVKGGIIIPDSAKEKPQEGEVIAVGAGKREKGELIPEKPKRGTVLGVGDGRLTDKGKRQPLQVRAGDQVLFSSYSGTEVKVDGEEMIIMDESDILAVLG